MAGRPGRAGTKAKLTVQGMSLDMKTTLSLLVMGSALFGSIDQCLSTTVDSVTASNGNAVTLKAAASGPRASQSGEFLVAGEGGLGLSSPDGLSWTPRVVTLLTNWRSVTRGHSIVVAVDCGGQLRTSNDEVNWTVRDSGTRSSLHSVACGNGRFVAVGNEGAVVTSEEIGRAHV